MGRVYKPNKFLDVSLFASFSALSGYIMYYLYVEGAYFWKLIISTAIVSVIVPYIEKSLRAFGAWASDHYLGDEKHGNPLGKSLSLKKFVDQGWQLVYHSGFACWEYILLRKYHWFTDVGVFIPNDKALDPPDDVRLIFIFQMALWLFQAFRHVFINQRKKDYYELFAHHVVTMSLCFVAYTSHYRSGLLILFLHDFSDIFVDTTKIFNLCNIAGEKDFFLLEISYAGLVVSWIYERLYTFPKIFLMQEYKVMLEYYAGESFLEIFKKEYIMIIQSVCLIVLYCLHWWWFFLFLRIGYKALVKERENYRKIQKEEYEGDSEEESDSEESEEEEKPKTDLLVCLNKVTTTN